MKNNYEDVGNRYIFWGIFTSYNKQKVKFLYLEEIIRPGTQG
jgi:hypothetical protein